MTPVNDVRFAQLVRLPPLGESEMVTLDNGDRFPPESSMRTTGCVENGPPDAPPTGSVTKTSRVPDPGPLGENVVLLAVTNPRVAVMV